MGRRVPAVTSPGSRPRPILAAALPQSPLAAAPVLSGPGYLAALLAAGLPVSRWDVLIATGLSLLLTALPMLALRNTVLRSEPETTPIGSPRSSRGEVLRPRDANVLEQALDELVQRRAADPATPSTSDAAGTPLSPTATSAFPDLSQARSMVAPGRERQRTAPPAGAPSADPPQIPDYAGDGLRAYDEARARDRGQDPAVRRGRDVTDRRDRVASRHERR